MADKPKVFTEDDFADKPPLTEADFSDSPPAGQPSAAAPPKTREELGAYWGGVPDPATLAGPLRTTPMSNAERLHNLRLVGEYGIPMAAGAIAGPEVVWPTRAALMGLAGFLTNRGGEYIDPSQTKDEEAKRMLMDSLGLQAGEALGSAGLGLASRAQGPLRSFMRSQGIHALGFLPSILRRMGTGTGADFVDVAGDVAERALENDVLTSLASSRTMARRGTQLADQTGQSLRAARQAVDASHPGVPIGDVVSALDTELRSNPAWRPRMSDAPVYESNLGRTMQDAVAHADLGTTRLGMEDLAALKQILARRAEYHANPQVVESLGGLMSDQSARGAGVVRAFEEGHGGVQMTPEDFARFMADKDLYGAMQELVNPDYGSLISLSARNAGNSQAGLLPTVISAGAGDIPSALGRFVATRALSQRGSQVAARGAYNLRQLLASPAVQQLILAAARGSAQAPRPLVEGLGLTDQPQP